MSETRSTDPRTGGQKGTKPEAMGLLPWDALMEVSKVYAFGAEKYAADNWRKGYPWRWSLDALHRHLAAFWMGQEFDEESGLPHLAHAAFHVLTLLVFSTQARYAEADDRPFTRPLSRQAATADVRAAEVDAAIAAAGIAVERRDDGTAVLRDSETGVGYIVPEDAEPVPDWLLRCFTEGKR